MAEAPLRARARPGSGAAPAVAERCLRAVERAELVRRPTEKAVFFAPVGARVFERTDEDPLRIRFGGEDLERMRGLVMTHNHPGGRSLSLDDVELAVGVDLAEIRAVGMALGVDVAGGRVAVAHRLVRPAGGWPPLRDIVASYERHSESVFSEFWARIADGRLSRLLANALHLHEVWTRVGRSLGLDYARVPLETAPPSRDAAQRERMPRR